jgi:hypothetical protein
MNKLLSIFTLLIFFPLICAFSVFASETTPGMIGVVFKSDSRSIGEQFVFANLDSINPFVTFPSGNGSEMAKVFDDGELIVLFLVANITGSTETFYIDRDAKHFTLIEINALQARVEGLSFKPKVTYGSFK